MSIYASLPGIEDARDYAGSNVLPSEDQRKAASVDLALIPSHITRDGRDDQPEDGAPWPWLRIDVFNGDDWEGATAVINPAQARDLARQLTEWADSVQTPLDRLRAELHVEHTTRPEDMAKPTEYEEH